MIKIDFHGSTHGHFLEYVTNVYIMQTTPSKTSIFKPPTYSAHAPDDNYKDNRLIKCGHFSNPKYNLSIIPVFIERIKNDKFKIEFQKAINPKNFDNKLELTKELNKILENMILRNPGQWIWTHNRWK